MVSILITHYNRFDALKKCVEAFQDLNIENVEIVVADDSSDRITQHKLKGLKIDLLLLSEKNQGLASNLNKGIKACEGNFILYCQEDFIPKSPLEDYIAEAMYLIDNNIADMCRLKANYKFPFLKALSSNFSLIPKFSWKNFYYNTFQYSDHPFIAKKVFFENYGYYLEGVSGDYGENEFAIRIMKSKAKIAIAKKYVFSSNKESKSVIKNEKKIRKRKIIKRLKIHKVLRAIRLHFEFLMYSNSKRKLYTIKNYRKVIKIKKN
jgi:glycosyltransferase involved in cell wall biosynthesis